MPAQSTHDGQMTQCAQCHFDFENLAANEAPAAIRHAARQIRELLGELLVEADGVEALRTRPEPTTWSALEYAGHVRDVLITQRERVYLTLIDDVPTFAPVHPERRVLLGDYNGEDPATTATEVTIAADLLARLLAGLDADKWARRCVFHFPEPEARDLAWIARHCAHEAIHHLLDIETVLNRAGARSA
jgi:hypothetical protein